MTWSPLVTSVSETSDRSARTQSVKGVVLHHAATISLSGILNLFQPGGRTVSAHLAVKDGQRVGAVPEQFRAWSLGSPYWDSWAMTVECANESSNGWTISAASHESLARLVADWARRYKFIPHRSGDPRTWTVLGHREVYSIHGDSYATACPGGMDLDLIVRRARSLMAGASPAGVPLEIKGNPVKIIYKTTTQPGGIPLWALGDDEALDPANAGFVETRDSNKVTNEWAPRYGRFHFYSESEFGKLRTKFRTPRTTAPSGGGSMTDEQVDALATKLGAALKVPTADEVAKAVVRELKLPGN